MGPDAIGWSGACHGADVPETRDKLKKGRNLTRFNVSMFGPLFLLNELDGHSVKLNQVLELRRLL